MPSIGDRPFGAPPLPKSATETAQDSARLQQSGLQGPAVKQKEALLREQMLPAEPEVDRKKRLSAQDAERIVSQAGYQGARARKKPGQLDLGDSSHAPIPLPDDDFDAGEWQKQTLEEAQSHLEGHSASLTQAAANLPASASPEEVWAAMVGQGHLPTEQGAARLQGQADRASDEEARALQAAASQAQAQAQALFGVEMAPLSAGAALAATSLLVAGHEQDLQQASNVAPTDRQILDGVRQVVTKSHKAVEDARHMGEGIGKNLALHRTFVHKR